MPQVSNYFTLPMRTPTTFDPNVKNFPIGMQNSVFGEPVSIYGDLGAVLLAESTTNIKTIFDTGPHFPSVFSQDAEVVDLTSRYVFCYTPQACLDNCCINVIPCNNFNATIRAKYISNTKIQDAIQSIGGIQTILPILKNIVKNNEDITYFLADTESKPQSPRAEGDSPISSEFKDWEIISSNSYTGMLVLIL